MPLRVLVVPDKLKGTLTARQAAEAIAFGWRKSRPLDVLDLLPMSDGGDGFGVVVGRLLGAKQVSCRTVDAGHRPCQASWWWAPETKTAIIETASVIGLAMLPPKRFHPFGLDTFGLGRVVSAARRRGARRLLFGIGGSATNDGGFGLARALGWRFSDAQGKPIDRWIDLEKLVALSPPKDSLGVVTQVAVDVQNKLLGQNGASRIYGPQKGLRPSDFAHAEACLGRLAKVTRKLLGRDFAREPGSGAAGGLGFGLAAFLGAKLLPGFELFADHAKLWLRLRRADLVITGEGSLDLSSLMGKGVGRVAGECRKARIACIGLAGNLAREPRVAKAFTRSAGMTGLAPAVETMARPAFWLSKLAEHMAQDWDPESLKSRRGGVRSAR